MRFQKSQPAGAATLVRHSASAGYLSRFPVIASAWVAPPYPGGKPPGMVGPIRCRTSCALLRRAFPISCADREQCHSPAFAFPPTSPDGSVEVRTGRGKGERWGVDKTVLSVG